MEVRCGEEASVRYAAGYLAVGAAYLALIFVPGRWWPGYYVLCGSVVFALITFFALRSHVQALFALMTGRRAEMGDEELPGVSLIIPCFNEAGVLPETIPAVLALDYPAEKLETLYVYESACTDGTEQILRVFAEKDARIKVLCRPTTNGGKAPIINFAILRAAHGIIGILDADHAPDAALVRIAVGQLRDTKVGCVRGRCRTRNEGRNLRTRLVALERDVVERLGTCGAYRTGGFANFGGGQGFFRREVFEQIGLFDEDVLTEDIDFSVRMHMAGYVIKVLPQMQSWEEALPSWRAFYDQRKRWCRGWIQMWRRYAAATVKASHVCSAESDRSPSPAGPGLHRTGSDSGVAALGATSCFGRSVGVAVDVRYLTPLSPGWLVWLRISVTSGGQLLYLPPPVPHMVGLHQLVSFVDEFAQASIRIRQDQPAETQCGTTRRLPVMERRKQGSMCHIATTTTEVLSDLFEEVDGLDGG